MPCLILPFLFLLHGVSCVQTGAIWSTTQSGDRLTPLGPLTWSTTPPSTGTQVEVDFTTIRQTIVGFGGAFTESAAYNFHTLQPALRGEVVRLFFGSPEQGGNGLTLGRVAINSPDFALSDYSYANATGDYALNSFDHTLARDGLYVAPFIQAAKAGAAIPLKLFATPWSPPAWMKTPFGGDIPRMDGSTLPGLVGACNASWAQYFSYWFTDMKKNYDLDFWAYTVSGLFFFKKKRTRAPQVPCHPWGLSLTLALHTPTHSPFFLKTASE